MRVRLALPILFCVFAEIAVFILVGGAIGVLATLGLTLLGMALGIMLLRWQSVATLVRIRTDMAAGRVPARPLFDGAMLALAALLMIVPGFLSDIAGALIFIPAIRGAIWKRLGSRIKVRTAGGDARHPVGGSVVELDRDDYALKTRRDSPWRGSGGQ